MSYSIPTTESSETISVPSSNEQLAALDGDDLQSKHDELTLGASGERNQQTPSVLIVPVGGPDVSSSMRTSRIPHRHWPTSLQALSRNSDISGVDDNQNERRDVVSYSQCCNMMRTEDVSSESDQTRFDLSISLPPLSPSFCSEQPLTRFHIGLKRRK